MRDDDKEDLATAGVTSASAAIAVAVATGDPVAAGIAAVGVGGWTALSKIASAFDRKREKRKAAWLLALADGDTDATAIYRLEEHADEDWAQSAVYESLRSVLDALDDAVIPALGLLCREYLLERKKADRFCRGFCRLLAELSMEEFADFRLLLRMMIDEAGLDEKQRPALGIHVSGDADEVGIYGHGMASSTTRLRERKVVRNIRWLAHLLIQHQFGGQDGHTIILTGDVYLTHVNRDLIFRMARYVRP